MKPQDEQLLKEADRRFKAVMRKRFNIVEHYRPNGSRVFAVEGYDMSGAHFLVIDCDSLETANTLANLLSERCCGVEVRDTFTDGSDKLHAAITKVQS